MTRTTHTYVNLELSPMAYDEIRTKLKEADYQHLFDRDGMQITLDGIAVVPESPDKAVKGKYPIVLYFEDEKDGQEFIELVKSTRPGWAMRDTKK